MEGRIVESKPKPLVLKRVREQKHESLRSVAKKLGVHWSTVSYWEHGIKKPRANNQAKLARMFDMPADKLLEPDDKN